MKNNRDYTNKTIFVGLDIHKKTYSVAVVCDNILIKRDTIQAYPEKLLHYLQKYFSGAKIKSAYEAGFSGFGLHRFLEKHNVDNIVVHAAAIEINARDKVKNDKRDATKIAVQLSANRLKGIYVPTPEMEDNRELTRLRSTYVKDRNRLAARLKQKANYHGLIGPEDVVKVSLKWIEKIRKQEMMPGLKYSLNALIEEWIRLNETIKEITNLLKEQAKQNPEIEAIYTSAKGVGPTAARILANELGDMSQFSSEGQLFSYVGLTPSEHSSGEHTRKGHITKQGKPILRAILVQCSWMAIRCDKSLRAVYERIAQRSGAKRAIVAVARRFIGRIRACFRTGELYREQAI